MSAIDAILELLKDGIWCNLNEIAKQIQLNKFKVEMVIYFLAKYGFIQLDEERRRARLTPTMLNFLRRLSKLKRASEHFR